MGLNAFEGARRILLVVQVLWALGVLVVSYNLAPSPSVTLEVLRPDLPARETTRGCDIGTDAMEWESIRSSGGGDISVTVCFRADKFSDGRMLVPYRVAENGMVWGDGPYTEDVTSYTGSYAKTVKLSPATEQRLAGEARRTKFKHLASGAGVAAIGWGVFWVLASVIGWIVRGFVGIPTGRDSRPKQRTAQVRRHAEPAVNSDDGSED